MSTQLLLQLAPPPPIQHGRNQSKKSIDTIRFGSSHDSRWDQMRPRPSSYETKLEFVFVKRTRARSSMSEITQATFILSRVFKKKEEEEKKPRKKPLHRDRDLNPRTLSPDPSVLSVRPRRPTMKRLLNTGLWWWYSDQRSRHLLLRSEFESRCRK